MYIHTNLDDINKEIEDLLKARTKFIDSQAELAASKAALEKGKSEAKTSFGSKQIRSLESVGETGY